MARSKKTVKAEVDGAQHLRGFCVYPYELQRLGEYDGGSLFLNICLMALSSGVSTLLAALALPVEDSNRAMFLHATWAAGAAFLAMGLATFFAWKSRRSIVHEIKARAEKDKPDISPPDTEKK